MGGVARVVAGAEAVGAESVCAEADGEEVVGDVFE